MTRNQIDWQNMKIAEKRVREDARHNLAMEQETARTNRANEAIKRDSLEIELDKLQEVIRNNDLNYSINYARNSEQARHNSVSEINEYIRDNNNYMNNSEKNRIQELATRLQDTNDDLDRDLARLKEKNLDSRERAALQARIDNDLRNYEVNLAKIANEKKSIENRFIVDRANATTNFAGTLANAISSSGRLLMGLK